MEKFSNTSSFFFICSAYRYWLLSITYIFINKKVEFIKTFPYNFIGRHIRL